MRTGWMSETPYGTYEGEVVHAVDKQRHAISLSRAQAEPYPIAKCDWEDKRPGRLYPLFPFNGQYVVKLHFPDGMFRVVRLDVSQL